ncbi:CpaD family pilus assembly lipoprotein [Allomesorhizobium camelthorni]|uniref:CpaD family pilus assembly lipoprotein n=1 Tax=Allomesorhizobium camelthorni TaxID=475069 RepID=A0A6G4WHI9_9HYPH|nr:CpaD family pilus assembly lipoprotein [Mesorhizobium camelthorni]NGO54265.1 CpaD family pilus assembly lipoprotein [Mesorhizobium camelthorni]
MTLRITGLLIALTASVSGCTSTAPNVEPLTPILIRQETTVLMFESLRASERQRLRVFLERASRGRRDALHLLISGSRRLSAETVHQAKEMGIDVYNIHLFDQDDGRAARIEAIVFHADPPVCPSFSSPLPNEKSFDQTLGCSIRHNLAVMVNDPHDLLDNRAVKPSNGDRAAIPAATYRTFATGKDG